MNVKGKKFLAILAVFAMFCAIIPAGIDGEDAQDDEGNLYSFYIYDTTGKGVYTNGWLSTVRAANEWDALIMAAAMEDGNGLTLKSGEGTYGSFIDQIGEVKSGNAVPGTTDPELTYSFHTIGWDSETSTWSESGYMSSEGYFAVRAIAIVAYDSSWYPYEFNEGSWTKSGTGDELIGKAKLPTVDGTNAPSVTVPSQVSTPDKTVDKGVEFSLNYKVATTPGWSSTKVSMYLIDVLYDGSKLSFVSAFDYVANKAISASNYSISDDAAKNMKHLIISTEEASDVDVSTLEKMFTIKFTSLDSADGSTAVYVLTSEINTNESGEVKEIEGVGKAYDYTKIIFSDRSYTRVNIGDIIEFGEEELEGSGYSWHSPEFKYDPSALKFLSASVSGADTANWEDNSVNVISSNGSVQITTFYNLPYKLSFEVISCPVGEETTIQMGEQTKYYLVNSNYLATYEKVDDVYKISLKDVPKSAGFTMTFTLDGDDGNSIFEVLSDLNNVNVNYNAGYHTIKLTWASTKNADINGELFSIKTTATNIELTSRTIAAIVDEGYTYYEVTFIEASKSATENATLRGDLNVDGKVDVADLSLMMRYLAGEKIDISAEGLCNADCALESDGLYSYTDSHGGDHGYGNGIINTADLLALYSLV